MSFQFTLKILFTFLVINVCRADETVVVPTNNGQVKGRIISVGDQQLNVFTSIRYGKSPVGDLRFKRPEPEANWTSVYDATIQRSVCYQTRPSGVLNESEDCLFLNVWSANLTGSMPVMFFIHGGGFANGYSNESPDPVYNGSVLATFGVVVVTINYRLGNLGFYYNGTKEAPGNVAFHDQILAMKWVKNNINFFGGDASQMTIFGESAGSMSVSFHVVSPLSSGLFSGAILQSGGAYHYRRSLIDPQFYKSFSQSLANETGCLNTDLTTCLRSLDPKVLMSTNNVAFPIAGDDFNPIGPIKEMRNRIFNPNVRLLVGFNTDEGAYFVQSIVNQINVTRANFKSLISEAMFHSGLSRLHYNVDGPRVDEVADFYFNKLTPDQWQNQDLLKNLVGRVWGEPVLVCPSYLQAQDYLTLQGKARPLIYLLTYKSKEQTKSSCNRPWQGVCHGLDIPFVFGHPIRHPNMFDKDDYQLSLLFNYYWTSFAKTGNPFSERPPKDLNITGIEKWPNLNWPMFDQSTGQSALMDINPAQIRPAGDVYQYPCSGFWSKWF